jgi:hypothetical protein
LYFSHFTFFTVSCYTPVPKSLVFFLHVFQYFSPYFMSYHVNFSFSTFVSFLDIFKVLQYVFLIFYVFQVSRNIPGPTVGISHSLSFSVFFTIFQAIQCLCIIFHVFFSFLATIQVLQCLFLIFIVFPCFLPYFMSYHVTFSFSSCVSFIAIFQFLQCVYNFTCFSVLLAIFRVIQCLCLIFHVCQFSCQNPGPIVCIFPISFFFHSFSSYFRSYSVCFSFYTFFCVSRQFSCPTM